jgi:hypothetical protein
MATALIAEFSNTAILDGRGVPMALAPPVAQQEISYTTSAASAAFNANTRAIRIKMLDADGYVEFGDGHSDPTATTSSAIHMEAGDYEYFAVNPGTKVAIYDGTS